MAERRFESAEEFEYLAGAFDHLLLVDGWGQEFDAVGESVTVADDATQNELHGVIGDQKLEH